MTTQPAVSRFEGHTLVGLCGSTVCAVTVGWLLASIRGIPAPVVGSLTAAAGYLPAAIDYYVQGSKRDRAEDIALMQKGELRRPVGLVVAMFVAGLAMATVLMPFLINLGEKTLGTHVLSRTHVSSSSFTIPFSVALLAIPAVALFFMSSYASHYLGAHPYRWTAVAVGCAFVFFVGYSTWRWHKEVPELRGTVLDFFDASLASAASCSILLGACWAGTRNGQRHHRQFVAKKLARMQRKAAREAGKQHESTLQSQVPATQASAQDSSAPQNSAPPTLVTPFSRPGDSPSAPDIHPTRDPFEEIEKLAHLRDTGALTEEEFQAKKTEILSRI